MEQDDRERENWVSVTVDKTMFEITMRRFYVGQVTKYNLEQWYKPLEEKALALGEERGNVCCASF